MSGKLAFVFSGQGSQKVGMLAEMAAAYPVVQKTFAEAHIFSTTCGKGPLRLVTVTRRSSNAAVSHDRETSVPSKTA